MCGTFSLSDGNGFCKNQIIFAVDNSSSAHAENINKDILILGKGTTDRLYDNNLLFLVNNKRNFP